MGLRSTHVPRTTQMGSGGTQMGVREHLGGLEEPPYPREHPNGGQGALGWAWGAPIPQIAPKWGVREPPYPR